MAQTHHRTIVRLAAIAIAALGFALSNPANAGGLTVHLDGEAEKGFVRCDEQLLADATWVVGHHRARELLDDLTLDDLNESSVNEFVHRHPVDVSQIADRHDGARFDAWRSHIVGFGSLLNQSSNWWVLMTYIGGHHGHHDDGVPVSTTPPVGQVPEPTSLALATLALVGLGVGRWRTTRKA